MIKQRGTHQDIAHDLDMLLLKIDQLDQKIVRKNQALCEKEVQAHRSKLHLLFNQLAELAQLVHHYMCDVQLSAAPFQYDRTVYDFSKKKQKQKTSLPTYTAQKRLVGK